MKPESQFSEEVRNTIAKLHGDPDERVRELTDRRPDSETLEAQTEIFSALSNTDRVRIIEILRDGECCACELQAALDSPQSTVASHLSRLRDAGLVRSRKDGKWTYYRIGDTACLQLLDLTEAIARDAR